ncbi:hypothetical protein AY599_10125 [Leptolyngbya valderiana BDU 20041]|nr:hypothetical protein AY599_10125 [Leptolyngbya valderiana BDU 20041]
MGDQVRVRAAFPPGHIRTPFYLRGRTGRIAGVHGAFPNPERLAWGEDGLPPIPLYEVLFAMDTVWRGDGAYGARDTLAADIYEHWLEETAT